jgi:hypothetical protein
MTKTSFREKTSFLAETQQANAIMKERLEKAAQEYHQKNPDQPYGIIKADFPGGRSKEFYIYPEAELEAMLKASGFEVKKEEAWRTEAGKPRKVIVAKLVNKVTPRVVAA